MSAPYSDIENKVEEAYKTCIVGNVTTGQLDGASVLTCVDAEDVTTGDRIVCECSGCEGRKGIPGNWLATVKVIVWTKANPPPRATVLAEHRSRLAYVRDFLMDSTLADTLSTAVSDFHVIGILTDINTRNGKEDDHFVSELSQQIHCVAADLA